MRLLKYGRGPSGKVTLIDQLDLREPIVILAETVLEIRPEVALWWVNWDAISWDG